MAMRVMEGLRDASFNFENSSMVKPYFGLKAQS
jgi:hypothetical protein